MSAIGTSDEAGDVQINTERLQGRQRRIMASILIPRALDDVWQILTDYTHLAEFIPNLTKSALLPHPSGGIRLEQIGAQCFLNIQFCARVVLDMTESFPSQLNFCMVEGDFKRFQGCWKLEPTTCNGLPGTYLTYDLCVQPPLAMPVGLIEHHLCANLSQNLTAIRQRALSLFEG